MGQALFDWMGGAASANLSALAGADLGSSGSRGGTVYARGLDLLQSAQVDGVGPTMINVVGGAHTDLSNTAFKHANFDFGQTVNLDGGGGNIGSWKVTEWIGPTFTADAAQTIDFIYTAFFKAPIASTNMTMTNKMGIGCEGQALFHAPGDTTDIIRINPEARAFDTGAKNWGFRYGGTTLNWRSESDGFIGRAPASAPADASLFNGSITWYLNEGANTIFAKIKKSDGTVRTLTTGLATT